MEHWEAVQLEKSGVQIGFIPDKVDANNESDDGRVENSYGNEPMRSPTPTGLPVTRHREAILKMVEAHQVVIVCGETGSGKSTQLPQFLHAAGIVRGSSHKLLVTQPRRLAAVALAARVAEEMNVSLGEEVGYNVRFDSRFLSSQTEIKFSTEGMMLREMLANPTLEGYSAVLIDEAHERTLDGDVIFGFLRELLRQRPDFRLIVSSATLDADTFANYFYRALKGAPDRTAVAVYEVEGRHFPVEKFYIQHPLGTDYIPSVVATISQIHLSDQDSENSTRKGSILVFLPGQAEIDYASTQLDYERESWGLRADEMVIRKVYSNMSVENQALVFKPTAPGQRKVVLATNIAETSLTIPDVRYVVDTGLAKQRQYDAKAGMDTLSLGHCSRASADQRAGRAGRTAPGKCYRLYTKQQFDNPAIFHPQSKPEILRTNLSQVCLLLLSLGVSDPALFPWIDAPDSSAIVQALRLLYTLGAITSEVKLTKLGRVLAEFPTDPRWARALVSYQPSAPGINVVVIAAAMTGELSTVFEHSKTQNVEILTLYGRFSSEKGDFHTLVNIYQEWKEAGYSRTWCKSNYLDYRSLRRARDVVNQLLPLTAKMRALLIQSRAANDDLYKTKSLDQAIANGFFMNATRLSLDARYYLGLASGQAFHIHPSSSLWGQKQPPHLLIYHELLCTTKEYMRGCMAVDPKLLEIAAPQAVSL